jgi:hypothetical protein
VLDLPELSGFEVRRVHGVAARKVYRCPECARDIAVGQSHVVAWPREQSDLRRHWHTGCWRAVARRGRL